MRFVPVFCALALFACTETGTPIDRFDPASLDFIYAQTDLIDSGEPCGDQVQYMWPTAREVQVPLEIDQQGQTMIMVFDRTFYLEVPSMDRIPVVNPGDIENALRLDVYLDNHDGTVSVMDALFYPNMHPNHAHGGLEVFYGDQSSACPRFYSIHGDAQPPVE